MLARLPSIFGAKIEVFRIGIGNAGLTGGLARQPLNKGPNRARRYHGYIDYGVRFAAIALIETSRASTGNASGFLSHFHSMTHTMSQKYSFISEAKSVP